MGKIAFVFPGQGAQYTGMGKDFYDSFSSSRAVFQLADGVSPISMEELIFQENPALHETRYTQVAMLCTELAILAAAQECGLTADEYAGLSLGEYAALAACGALSTEDALALIVKRGQLMQDAVPTGGAMTAVLGMENDAVKKICQETPGQVSVANYNCPGQIVITGESEAVAAASEALKAAGAKRCTALKVSGPFHSPMMEEAGLGLAQAMEQVVIHPFTAPYVTNVTAEYVRDENQVKGLLQQQISSSVLWQQSVEQMIADGVDTFVELGPKKTLTSFLKRINREVKSFNIETVQDLETICRENVIQ